MNTLIAKVYGEEGHRQRESFSDSQKYNFSDERDGLRILIVLNSDKTKTNDYTVVIIRRDSYEESFAEFQGQLTDGVFENSAVGRIEYVTDTKERSKWLRIANAMPFDE